MSTGWRILITAVVLYAGYRGYAMVVSPMTVPVVELPEPGATTPTESRLPTDPENIAQAYLPDQAWVQDAQTSAKIGQGAYAFFNTRFRINDGRQNRVRLSPFAVIWFDPKRTDQVPYTLTSTTAVIEFEDTFQIGGPSPGRIVGGQLTGEVRITGPDGLELTGQNFILSEESGRMYSDLPIQFSYGPAEGQSEQVNGSAGQIDITLMSSEESLLGDDLPRIGGIERITLRQNVNIDMVVEEDGQPVPASIHCDGIFEYDVQNLLAKLNEGVEVTRPTHDPGQSEQYDRLLCDQLVLQFEEKLTDEATLASNRNTTHSSNIQTVAGVSSSRGRSVSGLSLDLELRSLRALGHEVLLTSDENDVTARLQDLRYDLKNRRLQMLDDEVVAVRYRDNNLACADIEMTHDLDSRIQTVTCLGQGFAFRANPETGDRDVESKWETHLILKPDDLEGQTLLEMSGEASVLQRSRESGVMGDVLRVWLESSALKGMDGRRQRASRLPMRRVLAEQTGEDPVVMVSPSLVVEAARLEAVFEERIAEQTGRESDGTDGLMGGGRGSRADEPPIEVRAGEIKALMTFDPVTEKPDFAEVKAMRTVSVRRAGIDDSDEVERATDGPFSINCEALTLLNDEDGHIVRLQGQPARIGLPRNDLIEGNNILFDRGANRAQVLGPGVLIVHVDHDLDGEKLDELLPLTTKWRERMTFNGQEAVFLGKTVTTLSDSVLKCEELEVGLSRKIDFSEDRPNTRNIEVQTIHGQHNVDAEFHEWSERTTVKGIRKMDVAEFSFDRETGKFHAQGPGTIRDWQRGEGSSPFAIAPDSPQRNRQAVDKSELAWNYTQLEFSGDMHGNQIDRSVELENRVEVIHAPVEHALMEFSRGNISDLTESAKHAVWLGSDRMRFTLVPASEPDAEDTLEVIAFGNAEVEGQSFGATGYSISYDQSKELFTLRGGASDAHIWQQDSPGSQARRQSAKMIRYVPKKQLILTGAREINVSQ